MPFWKRIAQKLRLPVPVFAVLVLCLLVLAFAAKIEIGGRLLLREGRNVGTALHIRQIECYASGESLYDKKSMSGLSQLSLNQIMNDAGANGKLVLTGWDSKDQTILSFSYVRDHYIVTYAYDPVEDQTTWSVDYRLTLYRYSTNRSDG